jgi:hypothetical protein
VAATNHHTIAGGTTPQPGALSIEAPTPYLGSLRAIAMIPNDCDECVPEYALRRSLMSVAFSALPFIVTFMVVAFVVSQKLFPVLSGSAEKRVHHDGARLSSHLPSTQRDARQPSLTQRDRASASILKYLRPNARGLASIIFSTNFALSAVLVELILCEISNTVNRATRTLALKITLPSLLFLLVVATPAFEIHSVISGTGLNISGQQKGRRRAAWVLEVCGLAVWLAGFWYLGRGLLGQYLHEESYVHDHTFSEGCLERIAIIGISLMASLAGFAAISSLWHTFGVKYRPVSAGQQLPT